MLGLYSIKKKEFIRTKVGTMAAIYGEDGTCYAKTPNWPGLSSYSAEFEDMAGNKANFDVNEVNHMKQSAKGMRDCGPAGIRLGGVKYVFLRHDPTYMATTLACPTGGASVVKTNKGYLIGVWSKTETMSNGNGQNAGDLAMSVERVGEFLRLAKF